MTPHPQMQAILERQRAAGLPAPETLPLAEARENFIRVSAEWNVPLPPMEAARVLPGGVPSLLLRPEGAGAGLVVFVHGGGWTFGSPATHERFARLLAQAARCAVLLPDYRLAPEHPAPAAILDVLAVLGDLGGIVAADAPVVLCGDSAGANIALAAALEQPARPVALLSLLYGCFAPVFQTGSQRRNGDGRFGITTARLRWYWANWLGEASDPRAAPLHADMTGLPRCHLVAAGLDPLCDDSLLLADRLAASGVALRLDVVPGVAHGFLQLSAELDPAMDAIRLIAGEIAAAL